MLDPQLGEFARRLLEKDLPACGNQLLVLIALGKYASSEGVCWPAVGTLAKETALDPSTVRTAIKKLQEHGLLTVSGQRDGYKTNTYAIARELLPR